MARPLTPTAAASSSPHLLYEKSTFDHSWLLEAQNFPTPFGPVIAGSGVTVSTQTVAGGFTGYTVSASGTNSGGGSSIASFNGKGTNTTFYGPLTATNYPIIAGNSNGAHLGVSLQSWDKVYAGSTRDDPTLPGSWILLPDRGGLGFRDGSRIWGWNDHDSTNANQNELQVEGNFKMTLSCPNSGGFGGFQMGTSGAAHDAFWFQYDTDGTTPTLGFSKLVQFRTKSGGSTEAQSSIRAFAVDTAGSSNQLCFFTGNSSPIDNSGGTLTLRLDPTFTYIPKSVFFGDSAYVTNKLWVGTDAGYFQGAGAAPLLDIAAGTVSGIMLGAVSGTQVRTANTDKTFGLQAVPYANSQQPFSVFNGLAHNSYGELFIGGGTSAGRGFYSIDFYAIPYDDPGHGVSQMQVTSSGVEMFNLLKTDSGINAARGVNSTLNNNALPNVISPTGSPFNWTNTVGGNIFVMIYGGTVSQVTVNNLNMWTVSNVTIPLQTNEWIRVTYSAPPGIVWKSF